MVCFLMENSPNVAGKVAQQGVVIYFQISDSQVATHLSTRVTPLPKWYLNAVIMSLTIN